MTESKKDLWGEFCAKIRAHGWAVQPVFGDEDQPSFAYTAGLCSKGLPEILTIGLPPRTAQTILNDCAFGLTEKSLIAEHYKPMLGLANLPLAFRPDDEAGNLSWLARGANRWASENAAPECKFIQLVLPDKNGRFPWDPGCDRIFAKTQDPAELVRHEIEAEKAALITHEAMLKASRPRQS